MRRRILFNDGWRFHDPEGGTADIRIPHTWNGADGQDGGNDYRRGTCMYEKDFARPEYDRGTECVYIEFRGVNASAAVRLNGAEVLRHDGGYSTFRADITALLQDENHLEVDADNSVNDRVYPQKADFTFYGGIYRDVWLLIADRTHFDLDYYGGEGLWITPRPEGQDGIVTVETAAPADPSLNVTVKLTDREGNIVASGDAAGKAASADRSPGNASYELTLRIPGVHRWDGVRDPYLYRCTASLVRDGRIVDEVSHRFGVRSFRVDPEKGFFLNGRSYPLHGVARHQDRKNVGNALTPAMHKEDMDIVRELGANTIRLAHYQHDQYVYDLCDEYGFAVWAEIPYISEHMPGGRQNTLDQMTELIVQNSHHASIICWGLSNEITISTKDTADMLDNHRALNDLCHRLDRTRFTVLACYAMCPPFHPSAHLSDVVSWNLYLGWYVPFLWLNDLWVWFFHTIYPRRALGYSEYGAEGMPNLHSSHPRRNDHTEEYQALYHEYMLKFFDRHPYIWASHLWNCFDFAADARDQGGEPGMNHKGLVTFDRKIRKDAYYVCKAWWSKEPFVHLCGRRYADRNEKRTEIKVYSNCPKVALYQNGALLKELEADKIFLFHAALTPGSADTFEARAEGAAPDSMILHCADHPNESYKLKKQKQKSNWV